MRLRITGTFIPTAVMKAIPLFAVLLVSAALRAEDVSELWGNAGEKWSAEGRLPDFSFAGYRRGEEAYRIPQAQISVKDFGVKGDGKTDDIEAFRKAVAAGVGKIILIPAGRYVLSDVLDIKTGNLVLRGEGMEKSVLLFTRGLEEISPKPAETDGGKPTTGWSWAGGLINVQGRSLTTGASLKVTAPAARGTSKLTLEKESFKEGDEVILKIKDDTQSTLVSHLYRGKTGDATGLKNAGCLQVFRVKVAAGAEITLDRPLRFDVKPEWSPTVAAYAPDVMDVGVEELGFEFPAKTYPGHWMEVGWNPLQLGNATANCWARKLRFWNADNGIFVKGVFTTIEGIHLGADRKRLSKEGMSGHHGLTLGGADCLATNFTFTASFFHDLTLEGGSIGNVFSKGSAPDMNMDHHRFAPYENLFTDLDMGEGTRIFASGGGPDKGLHSAAGATFWNLRTKAYQQWPEDFGPDLINLVALKIRGSDTKNATGRWMETIRPGNINPPDLHLAMRARQLGGGASSPAAAPVAPVDALAATHRWKSTDGREIEARFGGLNGDVITLIKDHKPFKLPLSRLSLESQALARKIVGETPP